MKPEQDKIRDQVYFEKYAQALDDLDDYEGLDIEENNVDIDNKTMNEEMQEINNLYSKAQSQKDTFYRKRAAKETLKR